MFEQHPHYVFVLDEERRRRFRPAPIDPTVRSGRHPRRMRKDGD
jgi:hypothetical protein